MTLLDRFRAQPRHKHPDPAVRLAYVAELPVEDREAIAAVAVEDTEARVRRAAVAKLLDVTVLGTIARSDTDESVRAQAADMLRDIAVEAFEGTAEADSLAAVEVLTDARVLSQVAKTAPREPVARRALARVTDTRMIGSIARHGATEAVRLGAVTALGDRGDVAELLSVALHGEFKDAAAGAVDLLTERIDLEQVASRSRNKSAVKRARAILRDLDERASGNAVAEQTAAVDAAPADTDANPQDLYTPMNTDTLLDSTSSTIPADTGPTGPNPSALESDRLEAAQQEEHERLQRQEEEAAAERAGEAAEAEQEAARAAQRQARFVQLAEEAAALAATAEPIAARKRLAGLQREWAALSASGGPVDEALAARYAEADATLAARETAAQESEARGRREGLARMHNLLGRVEQLGARSDVSLKAADRALRDVRAALSAIPPLPTKTDHDDVTARLKKVQDFLTVRVGELREADEWQKWANVTIQEQLCAKMEALNALEDPEAIASHVRDLQQQWRRAADVPRDKADALWRRFKTAHDVVWARCEAHFASEAQERAENLAKKLVLCEQAEALADSTSWIQTAEAIKKLQADWKTIGPVSRGREKAIWDRFRTACDRFFTRRHEDLAQRKVVWAENLSRKEALCARAEAIAESTDWDVTAAEIKRLQAEWKTIGPVKKSRSEAIWQRFRSACDRFFERHAQRHDMARAERVAAREAICAELEALAPGEEVTEPPADLLATARALRGRWQHEIAARGVDPERARALDSRFSGAFSALVARWPAVFGGTDLDPDANRKRMEALVKKVEDLAASLAGPAAGVDVNLSPADRLAAMLKEALAANTIGGKAEDDSRWRAAAEEVRQAQAAWSRLGPVPDAVRRQLVDRFQRASRRISERAEAASRPGGAGRGFERTGQAGRQGPAGRPSRSDNRTSAPDLHPEPATTEK